jgi:hypothetical protein
MARSGLDIVVEVNRAHSGATGVPADASCAPEIVLGV